jgi:2-hydroxy-3-keto-5-methylthiopentenyl-1-phosphate phosphatase
MTKLMRYLDENFEKKSENMDKHVKSEKKISEYFVNIIKSIHLHFPELTKPFLSGNISHQPGIGSLSDPSGETTDLA